MPRAPQVPLPVSGICIDGANVIASGSVRAIARLDLAIAWAKQWGAGLPIMVFVDWLTARRCAREQQEVLRARCADVTEGRARCAVVSQDQAADEQVLQWARQRFGLVVSNDRFADYNELRQGVMTLQFTLSRELFTPHDHVTWFRPDGGCQRLMLDQVPRAVVH